jgi:hypothetical protein
MHRQRQGTRRGHRVVSLIGRRKPDTAAKGSLEQVPIGQPMALLYVLTFADLVPPSTRTLASGCIRELLLLEQLPDHPSIVKPVGSSRRRRTSPLSGMYFALREAKTPVPRPHVVANQEIYDRRAIVTVSPLSDYTLCDPSNQHRSFVHCCPDEAAEKLPAMLGQLHDAITFLLRHRISHKKKKSTTLWCAAIHRCRAGCAWR